MDLMHFQWKTCARGSDVVMASVWSTWKNIPTMSASANPHIKDPTAVHVSERQSHIYTSMWIFVARIWILFFLTPLCLHQCQCHPASPVLAKMEAPASKATAVFTAFVLLGNTLGSSVKLVSHHSHNDPESKPGTRVGVNSDTEVTHLPCALRGFFPNSFQWLLCGKRGDIQRFCQHDRGRAGVSSLEFQLFFGPWFWSSKRVLRLWWTGGKLLQVWPHMSLHGGVRLWKTFQFIIKFSAAAYPRCL